MCLTTEWRDWNRSLNITVIISHNRDIGEFTFREFASESEMLHLNGTPHIFLNERRTIRFEFSIVVIDESL